ncbi:MAG: YCF48-related protein [Bacteroidota bacterium]
MMRLLVLLLCLPLLTFAQEWQLMTPIKFDLDLVSVQAVGNHTFYLLIGEGHSPSILKTTDGGQTWRRLDNELGVTSAQDLHMFDEQNGVLAKGIEIYRTTDAAESFTQVGRFRQFLKDLYFVDNQLGFAVGNDGLILKTTDGGRNWAEQTSNTTRDLFHIFFVDANTGFTAGDGVLLRTTDGGQTWLDTGHTSYYRSLFFFDALNGVASGNFGVLQFTRDGGQTWQDSQVDENATFYDFYRMGNTLLLGGHDGLLLRSTDQGQSWTSETYRNRPFYTFDFDGQEGIVAGEGVVYRSQDGGQSWELLHWGIETANLEEIYFANNQIGIAVGEGRPVSSRSVYRTEDGGLTWEWINARGSDFSSVYLRPDGLGIIGREEGRFAVTEDYGENWQSWPQAGAIAAYACWIHDIDHYVLAGGSGLPALNGIYTTEDFGSNWGHFRTSGRMRAMDFPSPEVGYVAGQSSMAFKTVDGGASWDTMQLPGINYEAIQFLNTEVGFAVGSSPLIKTTDGGQTWETIPGTGLSTAVHFLDEQRGYVVNRGGWVQYTEDGGANWQVLIPEYHADQDIIGAAFVNGKIIGVDSDSDIFIAEIPRLITAYPAADLEVCDSNGNETASFDLTTNETAIVNGQEPTVISYHLSAEDADKALQPILDPVTFTNTRNPMAVYVRLENDTSGVYHTTSFDLVVHRQPEARQADSIFIVENDGDSLAIFDLTINAEQILGAVATSDFVLTYHESQATAEEGIDAIITPENYQNIRNPQTVYVRLTNPKGGCYSTNSFVIETDGTTSLREPAGPLFSLYPNPVDQAFWLQASSLPSGTSLQLYNTQGQLLRTDLLINSQTSWRIDSSALPSGVYILRIWHAHFDQSLKVIKR